MLSPSCFVEEMSSIFNSGGAEEVVIEISTTRIVEGFHRFRTLL